MLLKGERPDGINIYFLHCFHFQNIIGWGGGGGSMLAKTLHEIKNRAIRLLVFSVKTLNVIRCARYVYVGGGGGGGGRGELITTNDELSNDLPND